MHFCIVTILDYVAIVNIYNNVYNHMSKKSLCVRVSCLSLFMFPEKRP